LRKEEIPDLRDEFGYQHLKQFSAACVLALEHPQMDSDEKPVSTEEKIEKFIPFMQTEENPVPSAPPFPFIPENLPVLHASSMSTDSPVAPEGQYVLLSYSWADKEIVLRLKEELEKAMIHTWIDEKNIQWGLCSTRSQKESIRQQLFSPVSVRPTAAVRTAKEKPRTPSIERRRFSSFECSPATRWRTGSHSRTAVNVFTTSPATPFYKSQRQ